MPKPPQSEPRRPKSRAPWMPSEYELADASAIQALASGTATAEQQQRALRWLIEHACRTYDQTYFPGPDGARDSDFAQGRRSVGLELVKMTRINLSLLRSKENA